MGYEDRMVGIYFGLKGKWRIFCDIFFLNELVFVLFDLMELLKSEH